MESIELINQQLKDHFGRDVVNGLARWRVVWSDDQREKRFGEWNDFSTEGIFLRTVSEVREVPKYSWIQQKYVLEKLCIVPNVHLDEMAEKISYEPIHVFEDNQGFPLPPKFIVCKYIIDVLLANMGPRSTPKYRDPESTLEESLAARDDRLKDIYKGLFGNETEVGDALAHNEAIIVPRNYNKES
jgi:hypothetical protein